MVLGLAKLAVAHEALWTGRAHLSELIVVHGSLPGVVSQQRGEHGVERGGRAEVLVEARGAAWLLGSGCFAGGLGQGQLLRENVLQLGDVDGLGLD